ncbi:hypothetical protein C6Y14_31480 [Streptomyces dioscori]|uniref:DUF4352 domain-containing protein n=1 Tax=Streptomyces dioscori TaxID=2109333 RepID=A0A2P8PZK3_9ACTN|nr:hypothetical protein [Streptomyces dioscori]PSM39405.1 hypothetical protein C6Y14_31480 [Streptomyces dioscori]
MNIRRTTKGRTVLTAVAITTGLVLTVAGCGGGGDDDKPDKAASSSTSGRSNDDAKDEESKAPAENQVLAESKQGDISLAITSAVRDEGGFLTVSGTVTNNGSRLFVAADWRGDENELRQNASSVAGASLVDQTGKKKYLILRDTEGRCLCTRFVGGVKSGETAEWYAQFPAPPEDTAKVSFQVGSMPPASVEISEGE